MYRFIYSLPLWLIAALMLIAVPLWALGRRRDGPDRSSWQALNGALCIITILLIVSVTVFRRSPRAGRINLIPFSTLARARYLPELYRELLMNVLLFFPFGLTFSSALPPRLGVGRRFGRTVLAAAVLSLAVELIQLIFRLGLAEVDDLFTNCAGAALGACQLFPGRLPRKRKG